MPFAVSWQRDLRDNRRRIFKITEIMLAGRAVGGKRFSVSLSWTNDVLQAKPILYSMGF